MARSEKAKAITIGAAIALLPSVGIAWAFAVTAAEHVIAPHKASAAARVAIMCAWADTQDDNVQAICEATGAKCVRLKREVLLAACTEQPAQ